jgi:hypothetical protein
VASVGQRLNWNTDRACRTFALEGICCRCAAGHALAHCRINRTISQLEAEGYPWIGLRVLQGNGLGAVQDAPRADPMPSAMIFLSPTALAVKTFICDPAGAVPFDGVSFSGEKFAR